LRKEKAEPSKPKTEEDSEEKGEQK